MRKIQQKTILDLLQTLNEAHNELRKNVQSEAAVNLLADCQELALSVGEFIEDVEGDNTLAVSLLEEYCDIVYQASIDRGNANHIKKMQKQLASIVNSVKDDLAPNKLEVVFFPYKCAMADCLESIWLAAMKDPQCDVYICPIPYYDRLPDGSFGEMHYEGEAYAKELPIVDWKSYNVEARHPDIAFIHTPYDEGNRVTSVHPDFYSSRLCKLTDSLVYVPYFVSSENNVAEHFALIPGVLFSKRVVVQSEKMRQSYMQMLTQAEASRNHHGWLGNLKEKFLPLGSPKIDKVVATQREDVDVPPQWQAVIENKKVVLYNTSIGALLQGNEQYLIKLRHVLNTFRNRNDAVLLWRPHPLSETTYRSMRPQLLLAYEQAVAEYKRGGWGIFDDTPELNRAIALSDVYYGDNSSLVTLYGMTGKPMMLQKRFVTQSVAESRALLFSNMQECDGYFWTVSIENNGFYKINKQTWAAEYIGNIPDELGTTPLLYEMLAECDGKLYFSPFNAAEIAVFNLATATFNKIPIKDFSPTRTGKFYTAHAYGNSVFFFGLRYPAIIKLDTLSGELSYYADYIPHIDKLVCNKDGLYLGVGCANGPKMVLPAPSANAVVVFDMDSCTSKVYEVPSAHSGYNNLCYDGAYYWLTPHHGQKDVIIKWHMEKGCEEIPVPEGWIKGDYLTSCCYAADHVWYVPAMDTVAFKINIHSHHVEIAEPFMPETRRCANLPQASAHSYCMVQAMGDMVYAHTGKSNTFISYNAVTGERREEQIVIAEEEWERCVNDNLRSYCNKNLHAAISDCALRENISFTLEDLLDRLTDGETQELWEDIHNAQLAVCRENIAHADGTAGAAVYDEIKRQWEA